MREIDQELRAFVAANTPEGAPPPLGRGEPPRAVRRSPRRVALVAVAAGAVLVAGGLAWSTRSAPDDAPGLRVLPAGSAVADRLPSATDVDWVTYADHVVLVRITGERAGASVEGPGVDLVDREVTGRVEGVLWSRPDPDEAAPATVSWQSWGWLGDGHGGKGARAVGEGASRVEVGHTYVVALAWRPARCSAGDRPVPASWAPLGSGAVLPADGAVIGVGEWEGRERTVGEARSGSDPADPNATLLDRFVGDGVDSLRADLRAAVPVLPEEFAPPAPC